ncbi:hypothetical protein [Sulfobacillus harzensis]|uniref:Response regulatory domain-containing protein n=1 Tax=Sulfobacillus harzensis TaxID=2729629 RepID=A0A7Y0L2M5_9FIRM|nr:hypothetical protein [Sulfobacillus harzensis]NMP22075.1 hypothetical protein [Sulfobacillus harzensis]
MNLGILEDNMMVAAPLLDLARQRGFAVEVWRTADEALSRLDAVQPTHVLLAMRLVTRPLAERVVQNGVKTAAYGPHVEGAMFQTMRQWGISAVWPNSRIQDKYPAWLSS